MAERLKFHKATARHCAKTGRIVSKFSGEGRQVMLTYDENARQEVLQIDLDGDRRADFMLKIDSEQMLSWGDFVK
ncbi:M10 family metallopeptidase C-terminal domain-containing protein [Pseudomonas rhodesiae]